MSDLVDKVRHGLAALAGEARPVDLHDRVLASSRRLGRRRWLASAGAAVALAGVIAGAGLALPQAPRPAPVAPGDPTPTQTTEATQYQPPRYPRYGEDVLPGAMLREEDFRPDYRMRDGDELRSGHGLIDLVRYCGEPVSADPYVQGRYRFFESDDHPPDVTEEVYRYGRATAGRIMADLRAAVARCQDFATFGDPTNDEHPVSSFALIRSDFAADESMLIRETFTSSAGTGIRYHVALRRDDLYVQLEIGDYAQLVIDETDEGWVLELTAMASDRLCVATPTC